MSVEFERIKVSRFEMSQIMNDIGLVAELHRAVDQSKLIKVKKYLFFIIEKEPFFIWNLT